MSATAPAPATARALSSQSPPSRPPLRLVRPDEPRRGELRHVSHALNALLQELRP